MAKRFTDSNKYKKKFFRNLPGPYKLLWDFLYHDCDNCGIWIVDFEMAQNYIGKDMLIDATKALDYFNADEQRIVEIKGGDKWFLPGYIEFQYVKLTEKNRAHLPVISTLQKLGLLNPDLSLINFLKEDLGPLQGAKDKAKEKEMAKEKTETEFSQEVNLGNEVQFIVPSMAITFQKANPLYPYDRDMDFPSLALIAQKILTERKVSGNIYDEKNKNIILQRWGELVIHIKNDPHLCKYSLTQVNKHFQSVVQSFNNAGNGTGKKNHIGKPVITGTASGAGSI